MIACTCGVESQPGARFCRSCGRSLAGAAGGGEPGPAVVAEVGGVELDLGGLDGSTEPVEQRSRVVKGDDGRSSVMVAAAVLAVVAAVGLLLVAGGGTTDDSVDDAAEATDQASGNQSDEGDAAAGEDGGDDGEPATTPSSVSPEVYNYENRAIEAAARFGREVSYRLIISTVDGLATFNANNGEITYYERSDSLQPVAVVDGWLVAQTTSGSTSLVRLPIDDLSAQGEALLPDADFATVYGGAVVDGLLMVQTWGSTGTEMHAVDVAAGVVVTHPLLELDLFDFSFWYGLALLGRDDGAFTAASGGVYVADDDGIGQLSPGRLVADRRRPAVDRTVR